MQTELKPVQAGFELALYMDVKMVSNHGYLNIQVRRCELHFESRR